MKSKGSVSCVGGESHVGHLYFPVTVSTRSCLNLDLVCLSVCACVRIQPLMREVVENKVEITKQEARDLVERCLKVLYYRDARSYNRVSLTVTCFTPTKRPLLNY